MVFQVTKAGYTSLTAVLLGTKTAADAGLCHAHHGFGDMQCVRHIAACMEHDLRGAEHIQPPIGINGAVGAEGFHHGLLAGLGVVNVVNDYIAGCKHCIDIAGTALIVGAEVAFVVGAPPGTDWPQLSSGCTRMGLSLAV